MSKPYIKNFGPFLMVLLAFSYFLAAPSWATTPIIAAGFAQTFAIKSDGTIWAWGRNSSGQLGIGETAEQHSPVQVGSDNKWTAISAGLEHTVAMVMMGLSLTLYPVPSQAAVNCSTVTSGSTMDTDGDWFKDYHECYGGITTKGSQPTPIYGKTNCPTTGSPICLDPDNKNLFVILVPSTYFPTITNPLELVYSPLSQGGLAIKVHLINPNQTDIQRIVTSASPQKAIKITESLDISSPNVLGYAQTGIPQGLDNATIYTQRIINFLNTKYATGPVPPGLVETYIKHTIAHEVGHMLGPLAPIYNANYGGYHYMTGTNVIMDQSVFYKVNEGGDVTFYIGTGYTASDQSSFKLK